MAKNGRVIQSETFGPSPEERKIGAALEGINLTGTDVHKLMYICVDLLELCIGLTGKVDPAASWLVAHARDEVTLGVFGYRS
jgi:hypothetical protein